MGKTFRREKTWGRKKENRGMGKKPKLNTHRDLPDYIDLDKPQEDYPYDEQDAEEYHAKALHTQERNDLGFEGQSNPQDNRGSGKG